MIKRLLFVVIVVALFGVVSVGPTPKVGDEWSCSAFVESSEGYVQHVNVAHSMYMLTMRDTVIASVYNVSQGAPAYYQAVCYDLNTGAKEEFDGYV